MPARLSLPDRKGCNGFAIKQVSVKQRPHFHFFPICCLEALKARCLSSAPCWLLFQSREGKKLLQSSERASLASKSWSEAIPKRLRRKTAAELRRAYRPAPPQLSRVISWSLVVKLEAVKNIGYEQWCNRCVSEQYDSRANSSCVTLKHLFVSG